MGCFGTGRLAMFGDKEALGLVDNAEEPGGEE